MKIILTAMDDALAGAWSRHCGHFENVHVHHGSIFDVECDAVVSPANSFGFMEGGIDGVYRQRFGRGVQARVQAAIREHHRGELLVGAAEIVETGDAGIPYLVAAPTMRVPMILRESINPYLAARAVLLLVTHGVFRSGPEAGRPVSDRVTAVAFPGLGTGVGGIPPSVCAAQMAAALAEYARPAPSFPATWLEAQERHRALDVGITSTPPSVVLELVDYEVDCNVRLVEFLGRLPEADSRRDFGFGLRTPHRTMSHVADVLSAWSACVGPTIGRPVWRDYDEAEPLGEIGRRIVDTGVLWREATEASRQRGVLDRERRLHQVFHLVTHGTHHRAQVLSMITLLGRDHPFEGGDFGGWSNR